MNSGQGLLCRSCVHHLPRLWYGSHVSPCELVRWEDSRHHSPDMAVDGRCCPEFVARCGFLVDGVPVDAKPAHQIAPGSRFAEGVA